MQMYKLRWYNHTLDGIHIEMGIDAESIRRGTIRIDLHIAHRNLFDREKFNERTVPYMKSLVASWGEGYEFNATNLSARLSTEVRVTKSGFADRLAKELTRWSELGPIIDEGVSGL